MTTPRLGPPGDDVSGRYAPYVVIPRQTLLHHSAGHDRIQGRFIMSLNDRPAVRKIFGAFEIEAVQTSYSVSRKVESRGAAGEVLIMGGKGRGS